MVAGSIRREGYAICEKLAKVPKITFYLIGSDKFSKYGLCYGGYYFIRWRPAEFVKIAFLFKFMPRIDHPAIRLIKKKGGKHIKC